MILTLRDGHLSPITREDIRNLAEVIARDRLGSGIKPGSEEVIRYKLDGVLLRNSGSTERGK